MSELWLVAHKVHGEPAFDVATRMRCPTCNGVGGHDVPDFETGETTDYEGPSCHECDGLGYWWIVSTSGHRAYPWWHWDLEATELNGGCNKNLIELAGDMPASLPDHYPTSATPSIDLATALGLRKAPTSTLPSTPFPRRI